MLQSIATTADAAAFGLTVSDEKLAQASARVRRYTGQNITLEQSDVLRRGPVFTLPQQPVVSVDAAADDSGRPVEFRRRAGSVVEVCSDDNVTVSYTHGYASVPDGILEIVCTIADRLEGVTAALAGGVVSEGGGNESVGYGFDSYNAVADLSTGEKRALDKLFPKRGGVVVLRP